MSSGYYRYATIQADTVVFVCEDDLWSVPAAGGIARRLTSNLGEVSRPSLSPDGTLLAFVGREEGQSEIYLMPALGGAARRLTYLGGTICLTAGWTSDGKIIFANNAGHWYLRFTHLYRIDTEGHAPELLKFGLARSISFGPSGGVVIGRNTDDPSRWKRYRGGTTGQLWIDQDGSDSFRPLVQLDSNLASPMWLGERIYFISDHEGVGNLYSCLPSGDELRRHTDHEDFYVRNASTDGRLIVYHAGADLFLYDPITDQSKFIPVEFHSPQTQRNRKFVSAARYLSDWEISPRGQSLAITTRGKVFTFANWEGAVLQHGEKFDEADTGVRYRLPQWLNDSKRLIAVTDEGGEESFVIWNADGSGKADRMVDLDVGRPEAIVVNPKKDQIIFSNHRYELMFIDLESRELRLVDRGKTAPISGFDWSPDGKWVVYSVSVSLQLTALKLWKADTGEVFPLTGPVLRDVAPTFDPQGRFIYFLSFRTFDPVYDRMQFDLNFPLGMKPYLITLRKDLASPFIPKPRIEAVHTKEDEEEGSQPEPCSEEGNPAGKEPRSEKDQENPEAGEHESAEDQQPEEQVNGQKQLLQIDLEGIEMRVIEFPVAEGIYHRVLGIADGKVLYSRFPIEGTLDRIFHERESVANGTLFTYNFEDQKEEVLFSGITDFSVSRDRKMLIYRSGSRLRVLKASEKPAENADYYSRKSGWIDLHRAKVSVLPGEEWRQMFREAWRLQRDQFWTPDMSQINWVSIHDRYFPLVDRVSSRSEFSDLMWEMQGELGTSHAYEFGGDYRPEPSYWQGYLGADYDYEPEMDGWKITHIYQGDSWDPKADSPLNQPGINARSGDVLLAISGRRLSHEITPAKVLVNLAGEEVSLTFATSSNDACETLDEKQTRTITVTTLYSETQVRYREWVEVNRQRVQQASGGRVGYVHIPDMASQGYAEFHRGYLAEVDREGLIVDVRYNRGGNVSALILEKLARRRIGYDISRWGQVLSPYPPESVLGPMVAISNEYTSSDGDIFSHGFKAMKLGPLVGKRTWGGVIGINPRHSLVDGTLTTQPEFASWFDDVGWGVENYGTDPDIEVEITPQDYVEATDPQLARAIEEILKKLETNPPKLPEFTEKPSRASPKLPTR